ncbi:MAG TPA: transposase [Candidatus Tectomicrobia bacterium]
MQKSLAGDLALLSHDHHLRNAVALTLVHTAQQQDAPTFYRRPSVPGIGKLWRLVILDASHDLARFPRVQAGVSSCRVGTCATASAGKRYGTSGTQLGNADLPWACSEAAVRFLRANPAGQHAGARLEKQHGPGQALPSLAQHLARAVYDMFTRDTGFDMAIVLHKAGSGVGEPAASLGHKGISRETVLCHAASTASLNTHEHSGAWPCPGVFAWTLTPAPIVVAHVPQGDRGLPLPRT